MLIRVTFMPIRSVLARKRLKQIRAGLRLGQRVALATLAVVLVGALLRTAPALAVSTVEKAASAVTSESASPNPGQNLVAWLSGWVGGLFAIAIGGAGIAVAARRHVGEGLALLLVAVMVGGFVVDPADMQSLTTAIWHKIATGA